MQKEQILKAVTSRFKTQSEDDIKKAFSKETIGDSIHYYLDDIIDELIKLEYIADMNEAEQLRMKIIKVLRE